MTEKFDLPMADYNQPKLLYCSNGGQFLRILPDGKVDGTRDRNDNHSTIAHLLGNFTPTINLWYQYSKKNYRKIGHVSATAAKAINMSLQLLFSTEYFGAVYIKGIGSGLYLAMDVNGRLHGSLPTAECVFLEKLEENNYNTYKSKMHADKNWYVALKKNGNTKLGPKTNYGQKAILFLPLPVSPD